MLPDYTGMRFGRLLVVKKSPSRVRRNIAYDCICDCGKTALVAGASLKAGYNESCGCLQIEKATDTLRSVHKGQSVHGLSGTLTYNSWSAMVARCCDEKSQTYTRYGAKGIRSCEFLRESPSNLSNLIGERPGKGYTLDRIDFSKNYSCGSCAECKQNGWVLNVRWATFSEQACNKRNNVWLVINGERKTRSQWAEQLGIPYKKAIYSLKQFERHKVKFNIPDGYQIPSSGISNGTFTETCVLGWNGQELELVSVGGIPIYPSLETK